MSFVTRLSAKETTRRFRAAATLRYREACCLATNEERLGALYLTGYAAEMVLKAAYFRLIGKGPDDPIASIDRDRARNTGKRLGIPPARNFHDLRWWLDLLIQSKGISTRPFVPKFAHELASRIQYIDQNWNESLRYRTNRPRENEMQGALDAAKWLLRRYRYLYS
jgi:hypothetical protein